VHQVRSELALLYFISLPIATLFNLAVYLVVHSLNLC